MIISDSVDYVMSLLISMINFDKNDKKNIDEIIIQINNDIKLISDLNDLTISKYDFKESIEKFSVELIEKEGVLDEYKKNIKRFFR